MSARFHTETLHATRLAIVAMVVLLAACGGKTPEEQLATAQQAFESRDFRTASIASRSVLQEQPNNGEARLLLGLVSLATGDIATAESELNRARDLGVDDPRLALGIAEVFLRRLQPSEAQVVLAGITGADRNADVELLSIDTMLALGELDEAEQRINALLAQGQDAIPLRVRLVQVGLARGDTEAAAALAENLVEDAPDSVAARRVAGQANQSLARFEAAAGHYERAAELAAKTGETIVEAESLFAAAASRLSLRQFEAAGTIIDRYVAVVGDNAASKYMRASSYFEQQQYSEANSLLRQAAIEAPDSADILRLLGASDLALGNLGQARQNLQAALNARSPDPLASRLLAEVHLRQGRPELALEELREIDTTTTANLLLLAQTLIAVGDIDEAIALLTRNEADGRSTPASRLLLAQAYARTGDAVNAQAVLRQAVDEDSEDYRAVIGLLSTYLAQGDKQTARQLTEELVQERPDDPRSYAAAALFLQTIGETDAAVARAQQATARFPDNVQMALLLGNLALAAKDTLAAAPAFQAAADLDKNSVDALIGLAQVSAANGDAARANGLLEQAAGVAGDKDPRPAMALARLALSKQEFDAALGWTEAAVSAAPALAEAHALHGAALFGSGDLAAARASFERAVEQPDATARHYIGLSRLAAADNAPDVARGVLEDGLKRFENDSGMLLATAQLAFADRDIEAASKYAQAALQAAPGNAEAMVLRGDIALIDQRFGDAQARYADALELGAGEGAVIGQYRAARLAAESSPERYLSRWLNRFPDSPRIQAVLAQHYQTAGDAAKAETVYRDIIATQPDNAIALNNLAWLLYEAGSDEAGALARRAVKLAPESAPVLDTYGVILLANGEYAEALKMLAKASELATDNAEIRYHLARAQAANSDVAGARENLRTVITTAADDKLRTDAESLLVSLED